MKTVKLSQLCEIKGGVPAPDQTLAIGRIPFVRMRELGEAHLTSAFLPSHEFLTEADEKTFEAKVVDPGTILFPRSGSVHLNHRAHLESKAAIVSHIGALVPKRLTDSLFLYHLLTSYDMTEIMTQTTGLNMIRFGQLANVEFQIPETLPEQTKIAEVLSTVDRAIEQTEALLAKQQRIKTGLMQDLLTRGIDEHGNLRSEETHAFKVSPLGRIPAEWDIHELGTDSELVTSGSRGWAQFYADDGATFLRIGNLTRHHIDLRLDDLVFVDLRDSSEGKRTAVRSGDLLISITADLGIIGVIPENFGEAYVNQHIALVRLVSEAVNPRFIGWYLSGRQGQAQFETLNESGAKAGLNLPTIRNLLVPLPEPSEQARIAKALDLNTLIVKDTHSTLRKRRSLKTALMQDLLTREKRVTPLLEDGEQATRITT